MATGTAGTSARQYSYQMVHYLRKTITYADDGSAVTIGVLPSGAAIIPAASGALVTTVFNSDGTDYVDIGVSAATGGVAANDDLYATDLDVSALGLKALDEAVSFVVTADTTITATYSAGGSTPTTGVAEILIAYVPDNDQ